MSNEAVNVPFDNIELFNAMVYDYLIITSFCA